MYGNNSILDDIKRQFTSGNVVNQLIIINITVFLIINLIYVIGFLFNSDKGVAHEWLDNILGWIMLPADPMDLLTRPWTILTHMFAQYEFFHLLFNMLVLYWFGRIISEFIGHKKILPLYIMGGLTGAILLMVAYEIFPGLQVRLPALGASAGVLAIVVAAATLVPDYSIFLLFFGSVRIKYIALILVTLDLIGIPDFNSGGHIAHLGGALFGFIFIKQLQLGNDWSKPFNDFIDFIVAIFSRQKAPRVVYKNRKPRPKVKRPVSVQGGEEGGKQDRVDAILDKIASSGYDSLSKEEKEFLFRVSKED